MLQEINGHDLQSNEVRELQHNQVVWEWAEHHTLGDVRCLLTLPLLGSSTIFPVCEINSLNPLQFRYGKVLQA